jgi:hypothetical protein
MIPAISGIHLMLWMLRFLSGKMALMPCHFLLLGLARGWPDWPIWKCFFLCSKYF